MTSFLTESTAKTISRQVLDDIKENIDISYQINARIEKGHIQCMYGNLLGSVAEEEYPVH